MAQYKDIMLKKMQFIQTDGAADTPSAPTRDTDLKYTAPYETPTDMVSAYTPMSRAKGNANTQFSNMDKENIATRVKTGTEKIRNEYTPEDKRRVYSHYDYNHGAGNWRGNINGLNNRDTRTMSRAADAYNNATRWQPGLAGRRTNSSFGSNEMQANNYYKDTIETQDMRQMRANERVDEAVRMYDAARQDRVDSHAMSLQEKADEIQLATQQLIGNNDVNFGNDIRELILDLEYGTPNRAKVQASVSRYLNAVAMQDRSEVAQMALEMWDSDPVFAQVFMMALFNQQLPNKYEDAMASYTAQIANDMIARGGDPNEVATTIRYLTTLLGTAAGTANAKAVFEGLEQGILYYMGGGN